MGGAAARALVRTHQKSLAASSGIAMHFRRPSCGGTPHPNLPPQGGKGLVERSQSDLRDCLPLSPIGGWLFTLRRWAGFHARLFAGGAGALDLRIFAIQILRRALPMILRRALWPAGFFPKSVRSLPNPFFAIRVSCIRPFRRHAAAPFVYDA
jgi:hypothetical protein